MISYPEDGGASISHGLTPSCPAVWLPMNWTLMPFSKASPLRRSIGWHDPEQTETEENEQSARGVGPGQARSPRQTAAVSHMPGGAPHDVPVARGEQVPSAVPPAATEQAWQSVGSPSPQMLSQQTPSTQWPSAQALLGVQADPRGNRLADVKSSAPRSEVSPRDTSIVIEPSGSVAPAPRTSAR